MSSVELKPQQAHGVGRNTGPIVWSHSRDSVPLLLADRISLSQWQATFDAVKSCIEANHQNHQEMTGQLLNPINFLCPCVLCCVLPKFYKKADESNQLWQNLLRQEQERYQTSGIQVSFSKELTAVGHGSHRHLNNITVGLKFEVIQTAGGGGGLWGSVGGGGGDIVDRLEKLNNLLKQEAITTEEYEKAKAKILDSA